MSLVNLVISVPDVFKLVRVNAHTVVCNLYTDKVLVGNLSYNNGLVVAHIVYGVVYKVIDNLLYLYIVGVDYNVLFVVKNNIVVVLLNKLCVTVENLLYTFCK